MSSIKTHHHQSPRATTTSTSTCTKPILLPCFTNHRYTVYGTRYCNLFAVSLSIFIVITVIRVYNIIIIIITSPSWQEVMHKEERKNRGKNASEAPISLISHHHSTSIDVAVRVLRKKCFEPRLLLVSKYW